MNLKQQLLQAARLLQTLDHLEQNKLEEEEFNTVWWGTCIHGWFCKLNPSEDFLPLDMEFPFLTASEIDEVFYCKITTNRDPEHTTDPHEACAHARKFLSEAFRREFGNPDLTASTARALAESLPDGDGSGIIDALFKGIGEIHEDETGKYVVGASRGRPVPVYGQFHHQRQEIGDGGGLRPRSPATIS